jgi:hypothetical protein
MENDIRTLKHLLKQLQILQTEWVMSPVTIQFGQGTG